MEKEINKTGQEMAQKQSSIPNGHLLDQTHSRPNLVTLFAITSAIIVIIAYVWLISAGLWTTWPSTGNYYDQLATAFHNGQLFLGAKPDPALLALPDPYDPAARGTIPFLSNVSLYQGKYYLYFGPVPASIIWGIKFFTPGRLGDEYPAFLFISGVLVMQALLIRKIWLNFFRDTPGWTVPLSILGIGLIGPYGWMLFSPGINNAAIAGGQFFFLAGFYLAFTELDRKPPSKLKIGLAAALWCLAIGSRLTQIVPVGFMTIMFAWLIFRARRSQNGLKKGIADVAILGGILAAGLLGMGIYNWGRFGSPFESGLFYQLTNQDLQKYYHDLFSYRYVVQDIYNYFFLPPQLKGTFPYLFATHGNTRSILSFIKLPEVYYSQDLTGLIYTAPVIVLAVLPFFWLFQKRKSPPEQGQDDGFPLQWTVISLAGSFLAGLIPLLLFFWTATRYQGDFMPAIMLLSAIGLWQGQRYLREKPIFRTLFGIGTISLLAISIIASNLTALSVYSGQFKAANPVLWRQLIHLFSR